MTGPTNAGGWLRKRNAIPVAFEEVAVKLPLTVIDSTRPVEAEIAMDVRPSIDFTTSGVGAHVVH